jgi:hypothetical protein
MLTGLLAPPLQPMLGMEQAHSHLHKDMNLHMGARGPNIHRSISDHALSEMSWWMLSAVF